MVRAIESWYMGRQSREQAQTIQHRGRSGAFQLHGLAAKPCSTKDGVAAVDGNFFKSRLAGMRAGYELPSTQDGGAGSGVDRGRKSGPRRINISPA